MNPTKQSIRRAAAILVALLAVMASLLVAASPAAASVVDGSDPNDTGCSSAAETPYSVSNPAGIEGTLELRFSYTCNTAWARFTCEQDPNGFGCTSYKIYIKRNNDGASQSVTVTFPTITPIHHQLYTRQLNDGAGLSAKACLYNSNTGVTSCTTSF